MKKILWCLLWVPFFCLGQNYKLEIVAKTKPASYRGLQVIDKNLLWISGSKGTVGVSNNGGLNWQWNIPNENPKLDYRSIYAFDDKSAIIANAGSPAYILKTEDAGKTWKETYKNTDTAIFLDGMGFWDKNQGIIFGDPIASKMQLLKTVNAGETWQNISNNLTLAMADGEAGFAASNSSIKTLKGGYVWIATGGKVANIYFSSDYGVNWKKYHCPIMQGENSTGTFSIDFYDKNIGIAVGGNYSKDTDNSNSVLLTYDGGKTWQKPNTPVFGYRSSVCYIDKNIIVATGTSGTDVSLDGGKNFKNISAQSFNVVQKSRKDNVIFLVGDKGNVYKLSISK
jgi:photosystem II stability/assembly factor-like uncharacterized protein